MNPSSDRQKITFCLLLAVFLLLAWTGSGFSLNFQKVLLPPHKKGATTPVSPSQVGIVDIVSYASNVARAYYDLKMPSVPLISLKKVQGQLNVISRDVGALAGDMKLFKDVSRSNYHHFRYLEGELIRESLLLTRLSKKLKLVVQSILKERREWAQRRSQLKAWKKNLWKPSTPPIERHAYEQAFATVNKAMKLLDERLEPLLEMQERVSDLQLKAQEFISIADQHLKALKGNIFQRGIPLVFVGEFFGQFDRELFQEGLEELAVFVGQQGKHVLDNFWVLLGVVLLTFILAFFIRQTGKGLGDFSLWRKFVDRSHATAFFICLNLFWLVVSPMPPGWYPAFQFAIVVTVIYLSRTFFAEAWKWRVLYRLGILILIASMFGMVVVPWPILRLAVLLLSGFGIYFCVKESCHKRQGEGNEVLIFALRLGSVLLLAVIVAEFIGYAHLALYLIESFLLTIFAFLEMWMLYLVSFGLVEMLLNRLPFALLKKNVPVVLSRIKPLFVLFFSGLLLVTCLVVWEVFPTREEALRSLFNMGVSIGSMKVSLGIVVVSALVLYGAFLISWTVQTLLLQEVLPRRQISQGVRISITRLVHYGIILIGFLLSLRVLGFGLTNLTIIGGALGVGIGFGLQAIVNNFASGLILLFERPVKVGDTIQIGNDMAVVKRLGLRSTVVQTLDNAEIVIPNSSLVTEKVTNWTLASRRVRVRVPVGVAYGSDIDRVTEILIKCAEENSSVLKYPKPQALFLEFGNSSLNFELRVWVDEFLESTGEIQDDLNRDIDRRFREAGIEVPFPQTDLHLRSVDEDAARALQGTPNEDKNSSEGAGDKPTEGEEIA